MDLREWLAEYWLVLYFGIDLLLFVGAVLLWKPGTRPIAGLLFVVALIPILAFIGELLTPQPSE